MNAFDKSVRLEGERIVLRPFGLDDAPGLIEAIRSREDFLPPNFPGVLEAEPIAWFLREGVHKVQRFGLGIHLAATDRDTGGLLGTIGLFKVSWDHLTSEVGYGMRRGVRGRGYATEALSLVTDWALRDCGLFRVELRAMVTNHASVRVAEKAGYTREGIARGAERDAAGVNQDMIVFSRVATDPRPGSAASGVPWRRSGGASGRLVHQDEEGRPSDR
ncbi:GNAT family N-acetyltransferase [Actinomadura livida]|uniref:GNAT family N-acetyltransferase n=1 Tax=Actinomadura livida TaxID=79909 RepID=A0A7W7IAW1_9ACTN|nr:MULTISPECIES: GNAT family protein [Actinomadura]MBB4773665.1 RimJ/RimL family protein N-acetyltransferase [Actinomadura catellatispora]GGU09875.1 N-acetyltransferase [Actinomadura livida]